jgi:hypothetical protein
MSSMAKLFADPHLHEDEDPYVRLMHDPLPRISYLVKEPK